MKFEHSNIRTFEQGNKGIGGKIFDLEERLIKFTILCLNISETLPKTPIGKYYANQLIRSASSATLHYGEAKSAESRKDFIHKIKIILKELRESNINLKIIAQKPLVNSNQDQLKIALKEVDELISIFVVSLKTARNKKQ